jgi:tetrahydromethanopterin S-methyltransferase subunit A
MSSKYTIAHGASGSSLVGRDLVEKFTETQNAEAVERFKGKILEITGIIYVEEPLPDPWRRRHDWAAEIS